MVAALAGVLLAALARARPKLVAPALVLPLALLLAPTLAGHAYRAWDGRPLSIAADLVHVVAAAFWTGGILQLVLLLRGGQDERAVRRFSLFALPAVVLIAGSGLARALVELTAVSQLWSTGYGRAIVAKTVLFARAHRAGLDEPVGARRSRPPAPQRPGRARPARARRRGGRRAHVPSPRPRRELRPRRRSSARSHPRRRRRAGQSSSRRRRRSSPSGSRCAPAPRSRLTATVIGQTGFGVDGLDVRLSARSRCRHAGRSPPHPCGHGCYAASIALAHPSGFGVVVIGDGNPALAGVPRAAMASPVGHGLPEPGHPHLQRAPVGRLPRAPRLGPDPCDHDAVDARGARERRVRDRRRRAGHRDRPAAVGSPLADRPVDAVGLGPAHPARSAVGATLEGRAGDARDALGR